MYAFIKIKHFPYLEGHKLKQIHDTATKECAVIEEISVFDSKYEFILDNEDGQKLIEQLKPLTEQYVLEIATVNIKFENLLGNIIDSYKQIT